MQNRTIQNSNALLSLVRFWMHQTLKYIVSESKPQTFHSTTLKIKHLRDAFDLMPRNIFTALSSFILTNGRTYWYSDSTILINSYRTFYQWIICPFISIWTQISIITKFDRKAKPPSDRFFCSFPNLHFWFNLSPHNIIHTYLLQ